jgi:tRNA(fMet)-specific endonuclease VapC
MRYLLDTNILADLVRNPQSKVAQHIRKVGGVKVCTSIIVAAEHRDGAEKKASPRLSSQLQAILRPSKFCPWNRPPIQCIAQFERNWSEPGGRLARTICL